MYLIEYKILKYNIYIFSKEQNLNSIVSAYDLDDLDFYLEVLYVHN
jgi:hypothetical protein